MSEKINRVYLSGHLGADPEIRETSTGKKAVNLRLATNETYVNGQGEKVTETQWHSLVIWGKPGEKAAETLEKGSPVSVEGKLTYRNYVDKDGQKRYFTEIVVLDWSLSKQSAQSEL